MPQWLRRTALSLLALSLALSLVGAGCGEVVPEEAAGQAADSEARRIISLNPSLTAMLVTLGASDRLVGIDDWSAQSHAELADVERVGGLSTPSLEAVVALRPDLVALVPSVEQRDFRDRVEALGVRVEAFENLSRDQVLENIERLGKLVGASDVARERVGRVRATWAATEAALSGKALPRAVVVVQRDPLFVVGGGGFIEEMLAAAGARNVGGEAGEGYPRVSDEWLVATAPEVLIDTSPEPGDPLAYYARYALFLQCARGGYSSWTPRSSPCPARTWIARSSPWSRRCTARAPGRRSKRGWRRRGEHRHARTVVARGGRVLRPAGARHGLRARDGVERSLDRARVRAAHPGRRRGP